MRTIVRSVRFLLMAMLSLVAWAIQAEPGKGAHSGPWMISPYVQESGTYDSNIDQAPSNGRDDYFLTSEVGARAAYSVRMLDCTALGFGSYRNYSDATEKDFGAYGESVSAKYGLREQVEVQADEAFRHVQDNDTHGSDTAIGGISAESVLDAATQSKRNVAHGGVSVGRDVTDKVALDLGYSFDSVRYDAAGLANLDGHAGLLEGSYLVTDKSAIFAAAFGGVQENSIMAGSAKYYGSRLGAKTHGTDLVTIKAGAGLQQYDRPASLGSDSTAFNFDGEATWALTEKVSLRAGGKNGTQMSSVLASNPSQFHVAWGGAVYKVLPTTSLSLNTMYRIDEYVDPVTLADGTLGTRTDKGTGVSGRADYQTPKSFLSLYAEASYQKTDSNVSKSDDTRISVGANLKY